MLKKVPYGIPVNVFGGAIVNIEYLKIFFPASLKNLSASKSSHSILLFNKICVQTYLEHWSFITMKILNFWISSQYRDKQSILSTILIRHFFI